MYVDDYRALTTRRSGSDRREDDGEKGVSEKRRGWRRMPDVNLAQADGCFGGCRVVELNLQVASARPVHANSANRRECLDALTLPAIYNYSGYLFPFHSFSFGPLPAKDLFCLLYISHNAGRSKPQRRHRMVRLSANSSILILTPATGMTFSANTASSPKSPKTQNRSFKKRSSRRSGKPTRTD